MSPSERSTAGRVPPALLDHSQAADVEAVVLAAVRELMAEVRPSVEIRGVSLDDDFARQLGLDSLALAELLVRLEGFLGVTIPTRVLATAETPRDLVAAVRRAHPGSGAALAVAWHPQPIVEDIPGTATTLVEALESHVRAHPERVHVRLLGDAGLVGELTYADLWNGALTVAGELLNRGLVPGETVALMLPTGSDYFTAFTGVVVAGGIPVPVYPPARPSQLEDHLRRQTGIFLSAGTALLLTTPEARTLARLVRSQVPSLRHVLTPADLTGMPSLHQRPRAAGADVALVQYTSGSTGHPKGVTLTHANLLANIRAMGTAAQVNSADVFVSWLPLYHDMGLIGAWLTSLYYGMPLVVMPPMSFLSHPARWLTAITAHGGTLSASPNFGYELCLRIDDAELAGLDLSTWRMACNGAEPVNARTLSRFAERFAACGLRRQAIAPVYGLAEAGVGLAFPPPGRGPLIDRVRRAELTTAGRAVPAADEDPGALEVVACGLPLPGHEIRVVDALGNEMGERHEGHIEFRGPSATIGYFHDAAATKTLFHGDWLDTGDLGYIAGGDLYVTGRVKDLIIRAGRNLHPQQLEDAVGEVPGVRKGCVAVFAATDAAAGTERLVVLAETRLTGERDRADLRARILGIAVDLLGTPPDDVVIAPPGTVLKTSSGKLRRAACRERYEHGNLAADQRRVWWQLTRFAWTGTVPQLRRARRVVSGIGFAAYCWVLLLFVGVPATLAVAVLPRMSSRRHAVRRVARLLAHASGTSLTIHGGGSLTPRHPCVIVANHPSYLDSFALAAVLPASCTFVAGEVFARQKVVGFFLRRLGTGFVERAHPDRAVADTGRLIEAAKQGRTLVFFPEGGLSRIPGLRPFHMGAFAVAANAGLPIIPVAITGTRSMLRAGHRFVRPGQVDITVGEPIAPTGTGWDGALALERAARQTILQHCREPDLN